MIGDVDGRDGERVMRDVRALLMEWDALGVADEPAAADEYDCLIGPVVGHLRAGADAASLRDWIARERASHFGLGADAGADRALADALLSWWRSRTDREDGAATEPDTVGTVRAPAQPVRGAEPDESSPDHARP